MITLTTDFGYQDHYVGAMKGVIYSINSNATIVDITHGVGRHDVRHAAYVLLSIFPYFDRAVHTFVIDPGVGTGRKSVALKIGKSWYVGPDNGIVTYVADLVSEVYEIVIKPKSTTFHGRDVFAPAAAYIDMGDMDVLKPAEEFQKFAYTKPRREGDAIVGEIVHIDRFGNVITNIPVNMVGRITKVEIDGRILRFLPSYGFAERGELFALINSENLLEFAVNRGDASHVLPYSVGDNITVNVQH